MLRSFLPIALTACLLCAASSAAAASLSITPELYSQAGELERALQTHRGYAKTEIEGAGSAVTITYTANHPFEVYMLTLNGTGGYVPTDTMHFFLPAGDQTEATIDLTVSPSWSPTHHSYVMHLISKGEGTEASFYSVEFQETGSWQLIATPARQLLKLEPFLPSSYHALFGYRAFGLSVTAIAGIATVLIAGGMLLRGKQTGARAAIAVCVAGMLLYGLRFSLDLLRYTEGHLREWYGGRTYGQAEDVYRVSDALNALALEHPKIFLCRDGTNFKEKLLRYFLYPIPISAEKAFAAQATHVLLMDKLKWSVNTVKGQQTLRCGDLILPVSALQKFAEGTELFSLLHSSQQ